MRFVIVALVALLVALPCDGSGCRIRVAAPVYEAPVAVVPVVAVPTPVALFQFVQPVPASVVTDDQIRLLARELASVMKPEGLKAPPRSEMTASQRLVATYQLAAVAATRCMDCHTGPNAKGKFVMFNEKGEFEPKGSFRAMFDAVSSGAMPKGPTGKLPPQEVAAFQRMAEAEGGK